jgi:hypothetical protein
MGMYTELVFKAQILDDIPDQAYAVLQHLFNGGELPRDLPNHPLFQCSRWNSIGSGCSFYHVPFSLSRYDHPNRPKEKDGYIFSRSDLKNYEQEIDKFLDWVNPYIDATLGACIGWIWYEEDDRPTLVFKK